MLADSEDVAEESTGGYVGLANQGATCYLNSLLQTLFMTPEFTRELFRWRLEPDANAEARRRSIPHQLQMLFARLLTTKCRAIPTVDLTKSFRWDGDQAFVQHDVQELCRLLFDALEESFVGSADVTRLFRGQLVDFVACKPPHTYTSTRRDAFLDLQLAVRAFGSTRPIASVVEGLEKFLDPESLDGANQFKLDTGQKVDAWKGLRLAELPPLLTVHLKRFDIDYTTMRNVKISDRVEFGQTLRFVKKHGADGLDVSNHAVVPAWFPVEHQATADEEAASTTELLDYELYSVLVHAGTATSGHYFAYIKDLSRNSWLKFDDSNVTAASWLDVESTFGVSSTSTSALMEPSGSDRGGLFASSSTMPPLGLRSTTAYMLTYRRKQSLNGDSTTKRERELQLKSAAAGTEAVDGMRYTPGGIDPLDPRAVVVPSFLTEALVEDEAAKTAAEAARVERDNHLEVCVHCSRELLLQAQMPWHIPQQIVVTFRRGSTAAMLLAEVSQVLQKLHPEVVSTDKGCKAPLLTAATAQVCLLDLHENIIRMRWDADSPLDPKALLDSRRGGTTQLVYYLDQAWTGDSGSGGWFFGDGEPPRTELAALNPKDRHVSVTLLHATVDGIAGRCDVTLGRHPSKSHVCRAAAARFGLEPSAVNHVFRGRSMIDKDFVRMPTDTDDNSWEGTKWDAHPYLAICTATAADQGDENAAQWKWMKSAVSHAMTIRVLFTNLGKSEGEEQQSTRADARTENNTMSTTSDLPGRTPGGSALTTHSLLFDVRQSTDQLKKAMATVLNKALVATCTSGSTALQQAIVEPCNFNAFLKTGAKETVLNRPGSSPFQPARFRSGFSRLPCCLPLRLAHGMAADLRTRTLALRWHVPGEPGVALWMETVNAAELSLQNCKSWLLERLCADENATRLPVAAHDAIRAASQLLAQSNHAHREQRVGLRLRLYDTANAQTRPGKVLTNLPGLREEDSCTLSDILPPSDVPIPIGVSLLKALDGPTGAAGCDIETIAENRKLSVQKNVCADSLACEHRLSKDGHALVTLYRWLATTSGELGPATELVVEASISAAGLCDAIAQGVNNKDEKAAEHIELVRHWPRGQAVGPSQVIGKSWSRDAFDATVLSTATGESQNASPGMKRSHPTDEIENCGMSDDILRDGDIVYWRDNRESAASTLQASSSDMCNQQPKTKKPKQQSILSLFGRKVTQQQDRLSLK